LATRQRASTTQPPVTRDPERTRASILAAATDEFARHGLGGARVDRIAERAKVNKRMLYYYFGDKDELFLAVLEATYASIRAAEAELRLLDLAPEAGVRRLVSFTWSYYLAHPEFLTLLNSENLHRGRHLKRSRSIRLMNTPIIAILGELLRRGEAAGRFRPGVDPLELYISIAGICAFYLSNNYTLAAVFDRRVADPANHAARLRHMEDLVVSSLTNRDSASFAVADAAPVATGRSATTREAAGAARPRARRRDPALAAARSA
jgi:AcrR family transcriptional regulator